MSPDLEKVPLTKAELRRIIIRDDYVVKHHHHRDDTIEMDTPTAKESQIVVFEACSCGIDWSDLFGITQVNILLNTLNLRIGEKSITGGYSELYTVNTRTGSSAVVRGGKLLSKSRGSRLLSNPGLGSTVVVGELVYLLGCDPPADECYVDPDEEYEEGDDGGHFHEIASCFDLSSPDDGWKTVAPLPKSSFDPKPRCASLSGKIYSFRRTWTGRTTQPFLQVLDTSSSSGNWESFPPPPQLAATNYKILTVSTPVISDLFNNRILVHVKEKSSLYAYYPDTQTWSCLVHEKFKAWNKTVALFDGVIYFHGHGESRSEPFQAYHLAAQKWLDVVVSSEFQVHHYYIITSDYEALINLDLGDTGYLCLATFSPEFQSPKTLLTFAKLRVHHTTTKAIVTPISVEQMTIRTNCSVTDFLPIQVRMKEYEWRRQLTEKEYEYEFEFFE